MPFINQGLPGQRIEYISIFATKLQLMINTEDFEDIRPYFDSEVNAAINRVVSDPLIYKVLEFLFPGENHQERVNAMRNFKSVFEFQDLFMHKAIRAIVKNTSDGLSYSGFENINPDICYLFIGNHRDIVLDSAILQILLHENNFPTSEITFGSNLMYSDFVVDAGKLNKMFKVQRGESGRDFYLSSRKLSSYIRHAITEKKQSVWIAQRNGRTKDGIDKTEQGLIKMFSISGPRDFEESFSVLNIVPLTISYEYEPCDVLKAREIMLTKRGPYVKAPDEDLRSILQGIAGYKGRIDLKVGKPVNNLLPAISESKDKHRELAEAIDRSIHGDYKLWPTNFIAYDILEKGTRFEKDYSHEEKQKFLGYIENAIRKVSEASDYDEMFKTVMEIYAGPVYSRLNIETA